MASDTLRRKLSKIRAEAQAAAPSGGEKLWRLALARAFRDVARLEVEVVSGRQSRLSLSEILDHEMERALILLLQGPGAGLGLIVLSPDVLAGTVEMMTLGRCGDRAPEPRRPSRTDAAMLSPLADRALGGLQALLEDHDDLVWADGFHFASFIEEARPLGLVLDDIAYRVLWVELSLAMGKRKGWVMLVLPAEGQGRRPGVVEAAALPTPVGEDEDRFSHRLAEQVGMSACQLDAVLGRLSMPLSQAMALTVGAVIPIPASGLARMSLEGLDGRRLAEGKLGQHRGMRAIRLTTRVSGPREEGQPAMAQLRVASRPAVPLAAGSTDDAAVHMADQPYLATGT